MPDKRENQLGGVMYPPRHIIRKLCAPHNIIVHVIDMLVLVRHGISLRLGYVNISFILDWHKKTPTPTPTPTRVVLPTWVFVWTTPCDSLGVCPQWLVVNFPRYSEPKWKHR